MFDNLFRTGGKHRARPGAVSVDALVTARNERVSAGGSFGYSDGAYNHQHSEPTPADVGTDGAGDTSTAAAT